MVIAAHVIAAKRLVMVADRSVIILSLAVRGVIVYANNEEVGEIAGAMLMPIVTLAQNRAARMLANVVAVSFIINSFSVKWFTMW